HLFLGTDSGAHPIVGADWYHIWCTSVGGRLPSLAAGALLPLRNHLESLVDQAADIPAGSLDSWSSARCCLFFQGFAKLCTPAEGCHPSGSGPGGRGGSLPGCSTVVFRPFVAGRLAEGGKPGHEDPCRSSPGLGLSSDCLAAGRDYLPFAS